MAQKLDPEFLKDAKREDKRQNAGAAKLNGNAPGTASAPPPPEPEATAQNSAEPGAEQTPPPLPPPVPPSPEDQGKEEFKKQFDEFFKGNPFISGTIAVELVDDLKANLLLIYAQKQGVNTITKDMLATSPNVKKLTAFLVDHAIKNKLFDWLEKHPILGALGVLGISAGSSLLMIEMLRKGQTDAEKAKAQNEKLQKEIEILKKKNQEKNRAEAETVTPESETTNQEPEQAPGPKAETNEIREFIDAV